MVNASETLSLFEQFLSRRAMGLDPVHMGFDARDFSLQKRDPLRQLVDRYRIEILLGERDQRIVRFAREEVLEVHGGRIVDPAAGQVNKRRRSWRRSHPRCWPWSHRSRTAPKSWH